MKKTILAVLVGIVVTGAVGFLLLWSIWWVPNERLGDLDWLEGATPEEVRNTSHRVLSWPWGKHHDACLYLEQHGSAESVPIIIRALDWVDDGERGRLRSCSLGHCFDALRALTGENFVTVSEWEAWEIPDPGLSLLLTSSERTMLPYSTRTYGRRMIPAELSSSIVSSSLPTTGK